MNIVISWGTHLAGAPTQFQTVVNAAVAFLNATLTDNITVNIGADWGFVNTNAVTALGQSSTNYQIYTGAQVRTALQSDATSSSDASANATLDPWNGNVAVANANARALGLMAANGGGAIDGYVGFSSSSAFDFDNSNGVTAGTYDLYGVVLHEITEVLGRLSFVDDPDLISVQDFFRYSGTGAHVHGTGAPAYFSINNGVTNLGNWHTAADGDWGDWANSVGADMGRAFSDPGVVNPYTSRDAINMDVIGYNTTTVSAARAVRDVTGDGTSDVVLSTPGGSFIDWQISNGSYAGYNSIGAAAGYTARGTGFFNAGNTSDLLLQHSTGNLITWFLNAGTYASYASVGNPATAGYGVLTTGDFNGNGTDDILLTNASGNLITWLINGGTYAGYTSIGSTAGSGYSYSRRGDFTGDGVTDILLQHSSGNLIVWKLNTAGQFAGWSQVGNPASAGYGVVGVGDFNNNGTADVLLQNGAGNVITWQLQNGQYVNWSNVGSLAGSGYAVVGTGDYAGDDTTDILLRSGNNVIDWTVQNGTYAGWHGIGNTAGYDLLAT